jgi:hypothetical protein
LSTEYKVGEERYMAYKRLHCIKDGRITAVDYEQFEYYRALMRAKLKQTIRMISFGRFCKVKPRETEVSNKIYVSHEDLSSK